MSNFFAAFLRVFFAALLGTATVLTVIVLSPFLLIIWICKILKGTPPRR
jgi:hypothetical protein